METEIKISKAWLRRLVELGELAEAERKSGAKYPQWFPHLMGYIKSAEHILERDEK